MNVATCVTAHPGRATWCDGPRMNTRLMLTGLICLYACAAHSPENLYPACGAINARALAPFCSALSSQSSSWELSCDLTSEYHDPACEARRDILDIVFDTAVQFIDVNYWLLTVDCTTLALAEICLLLGWMHNLRPAWWIRCTANTRLLGQKHCWVSISAMWWLDK